jgi:hypothetical protein
MQECFMVAYYKEFDVIENSSDQSAALQMSCVVCYVNNVITKCSAIVWEDSYGENTF